jgi:hypothetical protein
MMDDSASDPSVMMHYFFIAWLLILLYLTKYPVKFYYAYDPYNLKEQLKAT